MWYDGSKTQASRIVVNYGNDALKSATWHYAVTDHEHVYTNDCDSACNICGETRTIYHSYGKYVYNQDALGDDLRPRAGRCGWFGVHV